MLYFAGYVQLMNLHVHVLHSFFFYTLNIVFCRICLIVESPYITFFIYFVCCISQDWACSMGKYLCITVFIYFVVCYSILPDIFNQSNSPNDCNVCCVFKKMIKKKYIYVRQSLHYLRGLFGNY